MLRHEGWHAGWVPGGSGLGTEGWQPWQAASQHSWGHLETAWWVAGFIYVEEKSRLYPRRLAEVYIGVDSLGEDVYPCKGTVTSSEVIETKEKEKKEINNAGAGVR